MSEMHKSRQYTYERAAKEGRTDVAEPMPLPEVEKYHGNREGFYNAVTEYAVKIPLPWAATRTWNPENTFREKMENPVKEK